jgi:Glycosyltransferase family 28 C-terminal domain/Monogalactosyldiacylglycerol (MGDG) synthase
MRKLTIVFFEAGGGHRNAADALKATLETQKHPWDVNLLNIQELLDSLDVVRTATGVRLQDVYNLILRKGWTRLTPQLLVLLQGGIRLYHSRTVRALQEYWDDNPTDLVLSVIPHFNRALAESISPSQIPFVTLLTDLADCPPHFWIERESQYLICGTDRAKQQALSMGHDEQHIFETSGMILKPGFYEKPCLDRYSESWFSEREKLGLDPHRRTGVVLFGGHGSPAMVDIAELLDQSDNDVQLIMLCGHNQKLAAELKTLRTRRPMVVEGFTSRVDYFMSLADFFIGKPGPGCISEALQFDLPLIVECNSKTLPQERYNAEWLTGKRLGVVLKSFQEIASGVRQLLDEQAFHEFQNNARNYSNRALFEVPVILDEIFEHSIPYSMAAAAFSPMTDWVEPRPAWAAL